MADGKRQARLYRGDVLRWAECVREDEPHDLADLEDVLLADSLDNLARFSFKDVNDHAPFRKPWLNLRRWVARLLSAAPLLGPFYYFEPGGHRREVWERWLETAGLLPVSVAFGIGVVFLVWVFVQWLRRGRQRDDGMHVTFTIVNLGAGVLMLWMGSTDAYGSGPRFDEVVEDPTLYLIPIWLTIALAIPTLVYQLRSPKPHRIAVSRLTETSRSELLVHRAAALQAMADRGLLNGQDPSVLNGRPLGKLHRPTGGR